jgi:hypothetical protein
MLELATMWHLPLNEAWFFDEVRAMHALPHCAPPAPLPGLHRDWGMLRVYPKLVPTKSRANLFCACEHARCIVAVIMMAIQDGGGVGMHRAQNDLTVCRRRKHSPSKSSCTPLVGPCGAAAASALYSSPALTDPCGCVCVCMARGASVKPTPAEGLVYQRRIAEASVPAVY